MPPLCREDFSTCTRLSVTSFLKHMLHDQRNHSWLPAHYRLFPVGIIGSVSWAAKTSPQIAMNVKGEFHNNPCWTNNKFCISLTGVLILHVLAAYSQARPGNANRGSQLANWLAEKTKKSKLDANRIKSVCERHKGDNVHSTIAMTDGFMLDEDHKLAMCRNAKVGEGRKFAILLYDCTTVLQLFSPKNSEKCQANQPLRPLKSGLFCAGVWGFIV